MISNRAEEVLRRIEKTAQRRYLPIIGKNRGQVLVDLVRAFKPKRILEVGTLVGYSTILMGKEIESGAEIVTIEIDREEAEAADKNIRESGIKPRVQILVGDAAEIIPKLGGQFDLIFLDADKDEYLSHLRLIEDKLHRGSLVVADNAGSFAYSMRKYLSYVRNSGRYESRFAPSDADGIEVSKRL